MYLVERTYFVSDPNEEISPDQVGPRIAEAFRRCLRDHQLGDLSIERMFEIDKELVESNRLIYKRHRSTKRLEDGTLAVNNIHLFGSKADYDYRNKLIGFEPGDDENKLNNGDYGVTVLIEYEDIPS